MAWVSPTGFNDPNGKWTNETLTYDEDTGTFATLGTKQNYLELTLAAAISCDKIRIWCSFRAADDWYVDVYYSAAWQNIHIGALTDGNWTEIAVGSTQSIDKARFTNWDTNDGRINEFDFNQVVTGWTGKVMGVTNPGKICGVDVANIAKVCGVA